MPLDAASFRRKSTYDVLWKTKVPCGANFSHNILDFDHVYPQMPSNHIWIHSILERRFSHFWLGCATSTQICSLRQGLIAYNTITHKIIQLNMPCYCPNNHISLFLIPDWSFRSRWTQKGDLKLRPQSSQICPLKGPYSWMVDWMSIRGIYYCLYEVHWLGSMVFHWYDTHLLKLLHAIWSPSTLKIGEMETKGAKKHICKRRPR